MKRILIITFVILSVSLSAKNPAVVGAEGEAIGREVVARHTVDGAPAHGAVQAPQGGIGLRARGDHGAGPKPPGRVAFAIVQAQQPGVVRIGRQGGQASQCTCGGGQAVKTIA